MKPVSQEGLEKKIRDLMPIVLGPNAPEDVKDRFREQLTRGYWIQLTPRGTSKRPRFTRLFCVVRHTSSGHSFEGVTEFGSSALEKAENIANDAAHDYGYGSASAYPCEVICTGDALEADSKKEEAERLQDLERLKALVQRFPVEASHIVQQTLAGRKRPTRMNKRS